MRDEDESVGSAERCGGNVVGRIGESEYGLGGNYRVVVLG